MSMVMFSPSRVAAGERVDDTPYFSDQSLHSLAQRPTAWATTWPWLTLRLALLHGAPVAAARPSAWHIGLHATHTAAARDTLAERCHTALFAAVVVTTAVPALLSTPRVHLQRQAMCHTEVTHMHSTRQAINWAWCDACGYTAHMQVQMETCYMPTAMSDAKVMCDACGGPPNHPPAVVCCMLW